MQNSWLRHGRMLRIASLIAVCFVTVGLATPRAARAFPVLYDAQFYYTGGNISIDVLYYDSVYDDVLQLQTAHGTVDVAKGSQVGSHMTLTKKELADLGIGIGDELQFALNVKNTGNHFAIGSGDLNADGLVHASVRPGMGNKYYIGFEDLLGGGDLDFNDTVIRFSGGMATAPPHEAVQVARITQVAEPSLFLLLVPAIGMLGFKRRIK